MISYDPLKREKTLKDRGLDFEDARLVFAGPTYEWPDHRRDYGEERILCAGKLNGRLVVIVYTQRDGGRRIISMRKANDDEQEALGGYFPV